MMLQHQHQHAHSAANRHACLHGGLPAGCLLGSRQCHLASQPHYSSPPQHLQPAQSRSTTVPASVCSSRSTSSWRVRCQPMQAPGSAAVSDVLPPPPTPGTLVSGISSVARTAFLSQFLQALPASHHVGVLLSSPMQPLLSALNLTSSTTGNPVRLASNSWLGSAAHGHHVKHMRDLLSHGELQHLIVEDDPTRCPLATAAEFDLLFESLEGTACLSTLVTVVDATRFVADALSTESLSAAGISSGVQFKAEVKASQDLDRADEEEGEEGEGDGYQGDDRSLADVVVEQVEYAHVIALHGLSDMDMEAAQQLKTLLAHLNRQAKMYDLDIGNTTTDILQQSLGTEPLDIEALQIQAPGWAVEISTWEEAVSSPRASHGVSTWRYEASRPFHPRRLLDVALAGTWRGVVRSKGYVWLATRHEFVGLWQSAGGSWQCEPSGVWVASVPESDRPADLDTSAWHPTWGDRCTQIVWTGINMQESALRSMLDACLLTDVELAQGPDVWAGYDDPLPPWAYEDEHEHEEGHQHHHDHSHEHHHEHDNCCDHDH